MKTTPLTIENPYSGETLETLAFANKAEVERIITVAEQGRQLSRDLPRHRRSTILNATADIIASRAGFFAELIAKESGKIISQAEKEVARCQNTLRLSAIEASRNSGEMIPFDSYPGAENRLGYFTREPLGIILAITPFNDPLNLVAHKVGPAIAAGNAVILKPSSLTPLSALALADAFYQAGLPESILSTVICQRSEGEILLQEKSIRMLSFTGGMATGEAMTRQTGLKKLAMDLGGNAPVIIMPDCDLEQAVEACVSGAFWANGQNCISAQRLFIHRAIYPQFRDAFIAQTQALQTGDPLQTNTDIGPMITANSAEKIADWVTQAIAAGAKVLCGHQRDGALYTPTVLEHVPHHCKVWQEEVFAPVALLEPIDDIDQAITLANALDYSLHAGIFTADMGIAITASQKIEAGGVMVNDSSDFRFDGMPFGGFKYGSMGREGVRFSVEEMTQSKTVCMAINT